MFARKVTANSETNSVQSGGCGLRPPARKMARAAGLSLAVVTASLVAVVGLANPANATSSRARVVFENGSVALAISTQYSSARQTMTYAPLTRYNMGDVGYWARRGSDGHEYGVPVPDGVEKIERYGARLREENYQPPVLPTAHQISAAGNTTAARAESGIETTSCGVAELDLDNVAFVRSSYSLNPRFGTSVFHHLDARAKITDSAGHEVSSMEFNAFSEAPDHGLSWGEVLEDLPPADLQVGSRLTATISGWVVTTEGICTLPELTATLDATELATRRGNSAVATAPRT